MEYNHEWNAGGDDHLVPFIARYHHADKEIPVGANLVLAGWEVPVRSYLNEAGQAVSYEYDFGDGWEHRIVLKEIVPYGQGAKHPICVGGERACPPEDCGGIWEYQTLLHAINDPLHEEHETMLKWLGTAFDSERFDPTKVRFDDPKKRWTQAFNISASKLTSDKVPTSAMRMCTEYL